MVTLAQRHAGPESRWGGAAGTFGPEEMGRLRDIRAAQHSARAARAMNSRHSPPATSPADGGPKWFAQAESCACGNGTAGASAATLAALGRSVVDCELTSLPRVTTPSGRTSQLHRCRRSRGRRPRLFRRDGDRCGVVDDEARNLRDKIADAGARSRQLNKTDFRGRRKIDRLFARIRS